MFSTTLLLTVYCISVLFALPYCAYVLRDCQDAYDTKTQVSWPTVVCIPGMLLTINSFRIEPVTYLTRGAMLFMCLVPGLNTATVVIGLVSAIAFTVHFILRSIVDSAKQLMTSNQVKKPV